MLIDKDKVSAVGEDLTTVDTIFTSIPSQIIGTVKHLFLSNNLLSSLQGVEKFANVQILSASNNRLVYLDSLEALFTLPQLKRLSLLGNPITKLPYYRDHVIALCEKLDSLDGVTVSDLDRVQSKLRYRQSRQCFRRAMDNVARNSIARHILFTLYVQHEMRKKVFSRMR
jgi:Leucine-rich repeat (LRR) protein